MGGLKRSDGRNHPRVLAGMGGEEGDRAPRPPEADMLAAHDAVTTNSRKAQQKLGKLVNQGRHAAHTTSLDQLPDTAHPPGLGDPLRGCRQRGGVGVRKHLGDTPSGGGTVVFPGEVPRELADFEPYQQA